MKKAVITKVKTAFLWLGNRDSNPNKQSQSLSCYRYTIPQRARAIIYQRIKIVNSFFKISFANTKTFKFEFVGTFCLIGINRISRGGWVSPAGSVGASATQRCPPDTRTPHPPTISLNTNQSGTMPTSSPTKSTNLVHYKKRQHPISYRFLFMVDLLRR